MNRTPISVSATLLLIALNASFWLVFALIAALGLIPSFRAANAARWIMAILALGASACLADLAIFLRRRSRIAFYAGGLILAAIAVLSITDQVGLLDLLTLVISLVALGLMLKDRGWYLQGSGAPPKRH